MPYGRGQPAYFINRQFRRSASFPKKSVSGGVRSGFCRSAWGALFGVPRRHRIWSGRAGFQSGGPSGAVAGQLVGIDQTAEGRSSPVWAAPDWSAVRWGPGYQAGSEVVETLFTLWCSAVVTLIEGVTRPCPRP